MSIDHTAVSSLQYHTVFEISKPLSTTAVDKLLTMQCFKLVLNLSIDHQGKLWLPSLWNVLAIRKHLLCFLLLIHLSSQ